MCWELPEERPEQPSQHKGGLTLAGSAQCVTFEVLTHSGQPGAADRRFPGSGVEQRLRRAVLGWVSLRFREAVSQSCPL